MRLVPLTPLCGTSTCPQVYLSDRGTIVVQGSLLTAEVADVPTSPGEALVELPKEVFLEAFQGIAGLD